VEAGELTLDDFAHHEVTDSVEACPAGHAPLHVTRDAATHTTVVEMPSFTCASCPLLKLCPIHQTPDDRFELKFTDQARGLEEAPRDDPSEARPTAGSRVGLAV
jgi:hypothetical protein